MDHILIIEDDENIQEYLKKALLEIDADLRILFSVSAARALQLAREYTISLFIIDIQLQDYKGTDLAKELRRLAEYKHTPMIFATAIATEELHAYRELKCYSYLIKPFTIEEVKQAFNEVFDYIRSMQPRIRTIRIEQKGMIFEYRLNDIVFVESFRKKMAIHMKTFEGGLVTETIAGYTLKNIAELLKNGSFQQCHKSFIINAEFIERINKVENTVKLSGVNQTIPIGTKYREPLLKEIK
ncbi:LytTR family two component transcriptional regulator [Sinobaca qinghaiensis]|uniref:LytTR family two component transcriptional regulator n=1 Tax=Sinobaca qinghaiensis TaxID=342944 RepID=A0A419UWS9_9BACL|nr:LytTR family DNA-binding domain-containing protein [Sinobaca qinghaiensis]RKD69579.1 LytTR family two component transcriptional regulator [Sinobaca qinghaiensis]